MLDTAPNLSISSEKICFIIMKTREFDNEDLAIDLDSSRSLTDDDPEEAIFEELTGFIDGLTEDEQIDLVALTWLGRGDGDLDEWDDLREEAARAHNKRTAAYLLAKPFLPDHLEEGLAQFGCSCEEMQPDRL
jgi:hypothetical protein